MILKEITNNFINTADFKQLKECLESTDKNTLAIEGISNSAFALIIAAHFYNYNKPIFVMCKNSVRMQELINDLYCFVDNNKISALPSWETLPYEFVTPSENIERDRLDSIYKILKNDICITVSTVEAVMRNIPSKKFLQTKEINLQVNEDYPFDDILETLIEYGYTRESRVEVFGQFSVKGSIIDLYPPSHENPVRLDFFGDTLDSIREFDCETQMSLEKLQEISIYPRKELILNKAEKEKATAILKEACVKGLHVADRTYDELENGIVPDEFPGIEDYFSEIIDIENILNYIPDETQIFTIDPPELLTQRENTLHTYNELYQRKSKKYFCVAPEKLISQKHFQAALEKSLHLQVLTSTPGALTWHLKSIPTFSGKISSVREELKTRISDGWKIFISTAFEGQARRLADLLQEFDPNSDYENIDANKNLNITLSSYSEGLEIESSKTLLLTDHDIFGKSYRRKKSFKKRTSRPISSFLDLKPGDYVVHINHGIGKFNKIERMNAGGIERDFLLLEYADSDKLYVSLDQLNMVQKYVGFEGKGPRIDSLGKKSAWNRIKNRVKQAVEEIAQDLIAVYAKRKALKGYQYPPDTLWQEEFEAKFEYEETPDQLTSIEDVKDDMESAQPMDRLICGDVGFGKTEIAIRAAFKAVMAGKQVAILVPTTILTMQHFKNFKKRFSDYPIKVSMISRFRSKAQNNQTKYKASGGDVDIVVGTHAILAKDFSFKNLGLLIIDEEQKFGVKHKEQLKKLRTQIDVLTLSATPIPRTLHMSMAGIRDLSIIATPPENRKAVETYVLEDNPDILKMAIMREIEREGQVFFIHNRVQSIDAHAEMLGNLVPEASIAVAHGQMNEHELENIMIDFLEKKYDILISTTIIESGVDMPNVNTIIINRADTFGLSQLYQLKGRVGRSIKKGYAYLFYPRHIALNEIAQKRLKVISEYSDLGSGFKIAMKDLEIRGSGNILGKEQSGSIMDVGFDLYCQMLEEAVRKLKGEKPLSSFRTPVFIKTNIFIPEDYISDEKQKIEFYKRFESCANEEEIDLLVTELVDRFGEYPGEVGILVELEKIRTLSSSLYIDEILEDSRGINIKLSSDSAINIDKIVLLLKEDNRFSIDQQNNQVLIFKTIEKETEKKLLELKKWLQHMSENNSKV